MDGGGTLGAARAWAVPSASQANQWVDDDWLRGEAAGYSLELMGNLHVDATGHPVLMLLLNVLVVMMVRLCRRMLFS